MNAELDHRDPATRGGVPGTAPLEPRISSLGDLAMSVRRWSHHLDGKRPVATRDRSVHCQCRRRIVDCRPGPQVGTRHRYAGAALLRFCRNGATPTGLLLRRTDHLAALRQWLGKFLSDECLSPSRTGSTTGARRRRGGCRGRRLASNSSASAGLGRWQTARMGGVGDLNRESGGELGSAAKCRPASSIGSTPPARSPTVVLEQSAGASPA